MKILNLYAGIGGNRRLWGDEHQITAVEYNESIAEIYNDLFPYDTVVISDAHQYLLDHFAEYDFIWASPPCPTHSSLGLLNYNLGNDLKYPDMRLYQEIIVLQNFCKTTWVVENVKSYYEPLIRPFEAGRHFFWSNFRIGKIDVKHTPIKGKTGLTSDVRMKQQNYEILDFHGFDGDKRVLFKNCVDAELGEYILNCATGKFKEDNKIQQRLQF